MALQSTKSTVQTHSGMTGAFRRLRGSTAVGGIQARRKASRKREKAARKKRPTQAKKVAGPVVGIQPLNQSMEAPILNEFAY